MCIKHAGLRLFCCICSVSSDVCSFRHSFFAERCSFQISKTLAKFGSDDWSQVIEKVCKLAKLLKQTHLQTLIFCCAVEPVNIDDRVPKWWTKNRRCPDSCLILLMSDVWKTSTAWVGRIFHLFYWTKISFVLKRRSLRRGGNVAGGNGAILNESWALLASTQKRRVSGNKAAK